MRKKHRYFFGGEEEGEGEGVIRGYLKPFLTPLLLSNESTVYFYFFLLSVRILHGSILALCAFIILHIFFSNRLGGFLLVPKHVLVQTNFSWVNMHEKHIYPNFLFLSPP